MKRTLAALLMAGLCVLGTGCTTCGWVYEPFGPGTLCTGAACDGCVDGCAVPACGACAAPTPADCTCNTACDACGPGAACTCASPCGPLSWLFHVLNAGYCGDGCGEIWWGDFHGAPPECCDPCNRSGEWVGRPGGPMPTRAAPAGAGGCSSCGGGSTIDYTFQDQPRVLAESGNRGGQRSAPVRQAARPISKARR